MKIKSFDKMAKFWNAYNYINSLTILKDEI